jgi:Sulfotransferase family
MCTLLDAHRDVAMSYELYPAMLVTQQPVDLERLAHGLLEHADINVVRKNHPDVFPSQSIQTFILRVARGGLTHHDFARFVQALAAEGHSFETVAGRMRLIEMLGVEKMKRVGKTRWGMKNSGSFADYLSVWPNATFLNMLRDGRDVLASQLNTGKFDPDPGVLGKNWSDAMLEMESLATRPDVRAKMVRYETLTEHPETVLREVCELAELPFDDAMLKHADQDLTIFKVRHLSGKRLAQNIDTSMIGRWKKDLSRQQFDQFMAPAAAALQHFGYGSLTGEGIAFRQPESLVTPPGGTWLARVKGFIGKAN